jgi:hypothetical protein
LLFSCYLECQALGLQGTCCPTPDGTRLGCCDTGKTSDEWKSFIYSDLAGFDFFLLLLKNRLSYRLLFVLVLDRDTAFNKLLTLDGFGIGNSRANSLFWAATRAPPVPGFNATKVVPTVSKTPKVSCAANSACDAQGMLNEL